MAPAAVDLPHTVRAEIGYLKNIPLYDREKPFSAGIDFEKLFPGARNSNISSDRHEMEIEDVRGRELQLTFEKDGCRIVRHRTQVPDLLDVEAIESFYVKECEELVKRETNADFVHIFNWLVSLNCAGTRQLTRIPLSNAIRS
ncbi:hypothetical protein ABW19_dt0200838 [Dactylella cylindrospora]|nr:hypothetical protein ABW19_dt0200838 [Dactylella cylindrospora]